MYFASSAGRGFIISDDEEITGVISVRNKVDIVQKSFSVTILYCDRKRVEQEHLLSVTRYLIQSTIHWKGKRKPSVVLNQLILSTSTDQTFPPTNQLISRMEMWRTTFGLRFPTLSTHDHLAWCKYIFICRHFHRFQVYNYLSYKPESQSKVHRWNPKYINQILKSWACPYRMQVWLSLKFKTSRTSHGSDSVTFMS